MKMIWPMDNEQPSKIVITQHFGENAAIYKQFGMKGHNGLDFRTRLSDSPLGHRFIDAVLDGTVIEVGNQGSKGYGRFIRIEHEKGSQTIYAHLKKAYVGVGEKVLQGKRIGLTDNTGFSTGPHLHFGYRPVGWRENYNNGFKGYVDPLPFIKGQEDPEHDVEDVAKWAKDAWEWAKDNHFCDTTKPKQEVTAEWVMTMIKKAHDMIKSGGRDNK